MRATAVVTSTRMVEFLNNDRFQLHFFEEEFMFLSFLFSLAEGDWGFATPKKLHIYPLVMDQLILTRKLFDVEARSVSFVHWLDITRSNG